MATVVHLKDLMANTTFEPPCSIFYGVCNETVGSVNMVMGRTTSGPDMMNQRHYHINCNVGQYRINGHDKILVGPNHAVEELEVAPGDFVYIPKGEIHGAVGTGENCELIFCYAGIGSKEESGTIFIEPPHDDAGSDRADLKAPSHKTPNGKKFSKEEAYATRARLIRAPVEDKIYAEPLITGFGINSDTVENPGLVMGTSIMPPGGRNRRHYHVNADVAMYKIKGHDTLLIGPDHQIEEMDFNEGDFVYIPKGEIHGAINIDNKEGFLVFCYTGINSAEEGIKIYVDPPVV